MKKVAIFLFLLFGVMLLHAQTQNNDRAAATTNSKSEFEYDANLLDVRINFFAEPATYGNTGFFGSIPCYMLYNHPLPISFSGVIKNEGSQEFSTGLSVTVTDNNMNEIYTCSSTSFLQLESGTFDTVHTAEPYFYFNPATPNNYGIYTFEISANTPGNTDENSENDTMLYHTKLDPSLYARDNNNITGQWSTCSSLGQCFDGDQIGVIYPFYKSSDIWNAEIFIGADTDPGTEYIVHLSTRTNPDNPFTTLTTTALINVDDLGTGVMHTVYFNDISSVAVIPGQVTEVLLSVEYYLMHEDNRFYLGVDSTAPTSGYETMMYSAGSDTWYTFNGNHVPLMRLNTEPHYCDISVNLGNDISHCGESISLDAGAGYYSYVWNGMPGERYHTVDTDSEYQVIVTDIYGCTATDNIEVHLHNIPDIEMSTTPASGIGVADGTATVTVLSGTENYEYWWSNQQNTDVITNLLSGDYCVTVTDGNGCTAAGCITVSVYNTSENIMASPITLFPVPAHETIYIEHGIECISLRLLDINGRILADISPETALSVLDISKFTPGMYFLQCTMLHETYLTKLSIE